uniref:Uncharacterized protein n=1 Tax=Arundo donax TaxID=35708 RepID=A0A0A8YWX2_ARUDO
MPSRDLLRSPSDLGFGRGQRRPFERRRQERVRGRRPRWRKLPHL